MENVKETPIYMASANGKIVSRHKEWINYLLQHEESEIYIEVSQKDARTGNVKPAHERIMALQHFPQLFSRLMFGIDIRFMNADGKDWEKSDGAYLITRNVQWLCRFTSIFKAGLFFLRDKNARFFSAIGDMLADEKDMSLRKAAGGFNIKLSGDKLQRLDSRVFSACQVIQLFFYGSGQIPKEYIETLIAEFGLPFTYEMVLQRLRDDLRENSWLSAKGANKSDVSTAIILKQKLLFSIIPLPHISYTCHNEVPNGMQEYKLPGAVIDSCEGQFGTTFTQQLCTYKYPMSYQVFELDRQTIFTFPLDKVKDLMIFTELPFKMSIGVAHANIPPKGFYILRGNNGNTTPLSMPPGNYRFICIDLTDHQLMRRMKTEAEAFIFMNEIQTIVDEMLSKRGVQEK